MLLDCLQMVLNAVSSCFGWFGDVIAQTGNGGQVFIALFLGLFVSWTFIRLFLVNFIGSVSGDAVSGVKEMAYKDGRKLGKYVKGD